jgi:transposase
MSRKQKYSYEDKVKACEDYASGKSSAAEIARDLKMGKGGERTVQSWVKQLDLQGPQVFLPTHHNQKYSKELKIQVVQDYLAEKGSIDRIANQYGLRSTTQLQKWVKKYTGHEELKDYNPQPEVYMASRKKTTREERIEIVQYCIDHDKDYKGTAARYGCSYSQVFDWVRKYQDKGEEGLQDKRGQRKPENELNETERLQRQVKILESKLKEAEMENELLKKLQEVEGRRYSPEGNSHRSS